MGLDLPELDDRTYEDYLEQAKKLIPAYSEEWTDFNPHDPGITMLELLAWLTETHTYQLDQITDEHREKYLRLLGTKRRRRRPASARLSLDPESNAVGERLPAGTKLSVTDGPGDTYRFETDGDVVLTDATLSRVVTVETTGRTDNSQENATDGMFYRPFGNPVEAGDTLYLGFDGDPFATARAVTLRIAYHDADLPEPNPSTDGDAAFHPSVELSWAYRRPDDGDWEPLDVARDGTRSLYEGGTVELARSSGGSERAAADLPPGLSTGFTWLRCRVERAGYEIPPQLDSIEPNVVTASHEVTVTDEQLEQVGSLGEPTALDGQTYECRHGSLMDVTVRVDGERFVEVPDFDASRPEDPHYVVDRASGRVEFGDGENGRALPADAVVTADYTYGGGEEGNVSPDAGWQFEATNGSLGEDETLDAVSVTATGGATGGADRETIQDALERVRRDLRTPYRGVTIEDYEAVTARTPGVRIGRTSASVEDGTVRIVVVPDAPADVPSPEPSAGFLRAVRDHVDERAVLTDRVDVTGPEYVGLAVTVTGRARPRFADDGHEAAIRTAIESYVHPLVGYDGDGWPIGRTLRVEELVDEITDLDAIDHVTDVSITAHGGTVTDDGAVQIGERALFSVVDVTADLQITQATRGGR